MSAHPVRIRTPTQSLPRGQGGTDLFLRFFLVRDPDHDRAGTQTPVRPLEQRALVGLTFSARPAGSAGSVGSVGSVGSAVAIAGPSCTHR